MATTICQICQREFEKHNGKQIYCGQDCYTEARRRQSHTPEQRTRGARKKQRQRERTPEHQRELVRESRARHREQRKEDTRAWVQAHPGYERDKSRKWRAEHPDYKKQEHARYYPNHKDVVRAKVDRRRARIAQAEGQWTAQEFRELCETVDWYCAYCLNRFDELSPDHIIPLARGGSNDISNIIPACLSCNLSKHTKTPLEFLTRFSF